jgi:outer membrane protein
MKIRRFLLLLPVLLCTASIAFGQGATRIAYIDASKLLKKMPEATDATSRLEQLVAGWNHDADAMQSDITRKQADFERRKLIMTDAERNAAEVDLQNLRKKLDDFRQSKYGATGELLTQQNALMKPAYDRLMKAIDEAARDNNYDYVIDRSSRDVVLLYTNSKYDLTLNVARRLGIESDILSQPLINQGPGATPQPNAQQSAPPGQPQPGTPGTVSPNPNQPPSFNSGSYNPPQVPEPPRKDQKPSGGR